MSKLDSLIIAKFKLFQIVTDSEVLPKLKEDCLQELSRLEKEIITLKKTDISNSDEDTYQPTGDRVQKSILSVQGN